MFQCYSTTHLKKGNKSHIVKLCADVADFQLSEINFSQC